MSWGSTIPGDGVAVVHLQFAFGAGDYVVVGIFVWKTRFSVFCRRTATRAWEQWYFVLCVVSHVTVPCSFAFVSGCVEVGVVGVCGDLSGGEVDEMLGKSSDGYLDRWTRVG